MRLPFPIGRSLFRIALAGVVTASSLLSLPTVAMGRQAAGSQTSGSQAPGAQNPVSSPGQTPPAPKTDDQIAKIRHGLSDDSPARHAALSLALDPIQTKTVDSGFDITFKVVARDSTLSPTARLSFSLTGAPDDATIDPDTGVFHWIPTTPGLYTFVAVVKDTEDAARTANTPVTIRVNAPLRPFGYSFFASARALIDYRLAVIRAGLPAGVAAPAGNGVGPSGQAASQLPIITRTTPGLNAFGPAGTNAVTGTPESAAPQTPGNGAPNVAAPDRSTTPGTPANVSSKGAMQSTTGTEQTLSNSAPNGSPQNTGTPSAGIGGRAPSGLLPPPGATNSGDNSSSADALRYFVGPFDMLGLNVFVPSPERYQLGPGDLLTIRYWSPAVEETEIDAKVDAVGRIAVPVSGRRVVVRGQTIAQAETLLRHELRLEVRGAELSITLKALRTMSITVLGDAYLPGSYQVPAVATLFNALYMFGGPSDTGSLREIELRRSDGTKLNFDLYRFLVFGDAREDVPLQPGDTIFIPPAGPRVTVEGEVRRPGIYEAAKDERLRSLIAFAGGPRATGVLQRVSLQTVEPSVGRELRDVDLSAGAGPASDPPVFDGDIATVSSVREAYTNAITLEGAVDQPGQYAAVAGSTVADLIARARGLLPEAYTGRADLFRRNPDKSQTLLPVDLEQALRRVPGANPELRPYDRLVVYSINDVQWMGDRQVSVRGAVQRPGVYYRADNMRVVDLLLQAGGLTPDAYTQRMFLQRTEPSGILGPLLKLDFARVAANDPAMNVPIQDRDVLTIQTVSEANYAPDERVRILGAVQSPGPYPRGSNMRLSDLIKLAGGPLPDAADLIEIADARVSVTAAPRKFSLKAALGGTTDPALSDGDLVTIPARNDILLAPRKVVIMGAVAHPGPYPVNGTTDRLDSLIARAGGFTPNSYPNGAQFFRDPNLLSTPSQNRFTPMIERALQQVDRQSYMRELAKSQIDKARALQNASNSGVTLPGATAPAPVPTSVPDAIFQQSTVSPARPLTNEDLEPGGNINVDLLRALRQPKSADNMVLLDGDIVVIPTRPTTVSVVGAVTVPSAVLFAPGKKLSYYIERSGGFEADAARDQILLIRYKGMVVKPVDSTVVELGDIIWVPTKVIAARLTDRGAEIQAIANSVISGAFVLAILRGL